MSDYLRNIARPILRIESLLHHPVERRMRPIPDPSYKPVLYWIDMDVIDMTCEVVFIANRMLPVSALPDAALSLGDATT